jgi:eukaryotic-like serine/threonine-protein kinase
MNDPAPLSDVLLRQSQAWRRGDRVLVESILARYPHLASDDNAVLDLIYNEVLLREEAGEKPALGDYLGRFPRLEADLKLQFEVDQALTLDDLAGGAASPRTTTVLLTAQPVLPIVPPPTDWLHGLELVEEVGRGAMGTVWRAWQPSARRVVAVKLLALDVPPGRVRTEIEAVTRLSHPNILPIFEVRQDGGRTALVLEYAYGGNLAKRLHGKPQPPREAATLVEALAGAMAHAHQRGVVHRDLKPSNVLLFGDEDVALSQCVPRIGDFGLAKLVESDLQLTRTNDVLGTPSYMAPEQTGGHSVGPLADVYSLGAILYECLTGRPPFLGEGVLDTLEQLRSQEPVPPSRLQPRTPRDLEVICLKCLHKEPKKRYPSAAALADDLERWGRGEPTVARPLGPAGRLLSWARRNPMVAALLAALALAVGGGLVGSSSQWLRAERRGADARRQQRRAEENYRQAKETVDDSFVLVSEELLLHQQGLQPLRKQLLERALRYYQRFLAHGSEDPALRPQLAFTYLRVGQIANEIGSRAEALAAFGEALGLYEQLADSGPEDPTFRREQARCHHFIGFLQTEDGRLTEAGHSLECARALLEPFAGTDDAGLANDLARLYQDIGVVRQQRRQSAEALTWYGQARALWAPLAERGAAASPFRRGDLAKLYHDTAVAHAEMGQTAEALRWYEQARTLKEELVAAHPTIARFQFESAATYYNLGQLHFDTGRRAEALRWFERGREVLEKLTAANPDVTRFRQRLAVTYLNIGNTQPEGARPEEVRRWYDQARAVLERIGAADPGAARESEDLARAHRMVGDLQRAQEQSAEALASFEAALRLQEQLAQANPDVPVFRYELALTHNRIGMLLRSTDRLPEAHQSLEKALRVNEQLVEGHPGSSRFQSELGATLHNLGMVLRQQKRPEEALAVVRRAVEHQRAALRRSPRVVYYRRFLGNHYINLWNVQLDLGRPAEAAAAALELKALWPGSPAEQVQAARLLSLVAEAVGKGKAELSAEERTERERYAGQAMQVLREAVALGYEDAKNLKEHPEFAPLRSRDDFRKLVARLESEPIPAPRIEPRPAPAR